MHEDLSDGNDLTHCLPPCKNDTYNCMYLYFLKSHK